MPENPILESPPSMLERLVGNRVTEKDIRDHLERHGYLGSSARFRELELHAIRRPGWQQVFRFRCAVTTRKGDRVQLFGVVRDDERESTEFFTSESQATQHQQLEAWSVGMLKCQPTQRTLVHWILLAGFFALMAVAVVGCLLTPA